MIKVVNALPAGRTAVMDDVTIYLCGSNHLFLVVWPHVFDAVYRRVIVRYVWNLQDAKQAARAENWTFKIVECACRATTKRAARMPRRDLDAALAAYRIGGMKAAAALIKATDRVVTHDVSRYNDPLLWNYGHFVPALDWSTA